MFSKKFSSNLKKRRRALTSIIVIFALTLGLGYAVFGSNLNFLGSLSLNAKTLNVYVKSVSPTSGSVTPTSAAEIVGNDRQEVDFSTSLPTLTDYYEVSTVIRNGGKSKAYYIDYELKVYDEDGNEIELPSELEVTVLNSDGTEIVKDHELSTQNEETFKIKFNYKSGATLPSPQPIYTIKVVFNYDLEPAVIKYLYDVIKNEAESGGLAAKYTGSHNDTLNNTGDKDIYYFTSPKTDDKTQGNQIREKYNIKLGNMCWQMIRTTDTGGVKLIYNGEYDSTNKCNDSRGTHKGIIGTNGSTQDLSSPYVYGDTYSYDLTTGNFTLQNTTTATWGDSTADNLIGKYTCKSSSNTCTTLYGVNGYQDLTTAYTASYTIADTAYSQIGTTPFNANYRSPAMVGYMFNKVYKKQEGGAPASDSLMGNDVKYENGQYSLLPASGETELGTTLNNTHHYTCDNTTGKCTTVRYYYYHYNGSSYYYYIELTGGTTIEDAVNEMLYADNVNRYNSSIKGAIDAWYRQNMTSYTNKLEDIIYCYDRVQANAVANGWNKNGNLSGHIYFYNSSGIKLNCSNITDKFAITNEKAKLENPVGLITDSEMSLFKNSIPFQTGQNYLLGNPDNYDGVARIGGVDTYYGLNIGYGTSTSYGIRPAISLKPGTEYTSGDGSMNNPYVIKLD